MARVLRNHWRWFADRPRAGRLGGAGGVDCIAHRDGLGNHRQRLARGDDWAIRRPSAAGRAARFDSANRILAGGNRSRFWHMNSTRRIVARRGADARHLHRRLSSAAFGRFGRSAGSRYLPRPETAGARRQRESERRAKQLQLAAQATTEFPDCHRPGRRVPKNAPSYLDRRRTRKTRRTGETLSKNAKNMTPRIRFMIFSLPTICFRTPTTLLAATRLQPQTETRRRTPCWKSTDGKKSSLKMPQSQKSSTG